MKKVGKKIITALLAVFFAWFGGAFVQATHFVSAASAVTVDLSQGVCTEFAQFSEYTDTHRTRILLHEGSETWGPYVANLDAPDWLAYIKVNGKSIAQHKNEYEAAGRYELNTSDPYISDYGCAPIAVILPTASMNGNNCYLDILIPEAFIPAASMQSVEINGPITYTYDGYSTVSYAFTGFLSVENSTDAGTMYAVSIDGVVHTIKEGALIPCPETPTKEGTESHRYEFVGWYYMDGAFKIYWDFDKDAVTKDVALYSEFRAVEKAKYTVTVELDNGEAPLQYSVYEGSAVTLPVPVKAETAEEKYTFEKWLDADMGTAFDLSTPISGDINLKASYTVTPKHLVTIGDTVSRVLHGEKLTRPADPTKAETATHVYEFIGWSYTEGGVTSFWDFEVNTVTGALTLTAQFRAVEKTVYTVTIDADDGKTPIVLTVTAGNVLPSEQRPLPPQKAPTEEAEYVFDNWFNADTGALFDFDQPIYSDVTVVAKYHIFRKFLVTVNGEDKVVMEGTRLEMPSTPTKEGTQSHTYEFIGWYYIQEGRKTYWNFEEDTVFGDLVLEPDFKEIEKIKYTVTFDCDNGMPPITVQVYEGALISAEQKPGDPQKTTADHTVYTFHSWSLDGVTAWDFARDEVLGDMTLKAYYTTKTTCIVTFDGVAMICEPGTYLTKPADPTKPSTEEYDYTFDGWYYMDGGETKAWNFQTDVVTSDVALVSQFLQSKAKYTLYIYINETEPIARKLAWGEIISYPTLGDDAWRTHLGWVDSEGAPSVTVMPKADVVAYANWALKEFTATVRSESLVLHKELYTLDTAEKALDNLKNLLIEISDAEYSYAWSTELPAALLPQNSEFNVVSTKRSYRLTIISDRESGESQAQVLVWGEEIVLPIPEPQEGKEFLGWTTEAGGEVPAKMPTSNLVVYGNWDYQKYTMTVVDGNGERQVLTYTVREANDRTYVKALFDRFLIAENPNAYAFSWKTPVPERLPLTNGEVYELVKTPILYTITFANAEGMEPVTFHVENLHTLQLPEPPSKLGYTAKWDKALSEIGLEDTTLTAVYTIVTYTLTFVGVENAKDVTFTIETFASIQLPELPEKEGYTVHWDKDISKLGLEDATLTAVYEPIEYTLTFAGVSGIDPIPFTVLTKGELRLPEVPALEGYVGSWNKTLDEIGLEDTVITAIYQPITFKATFIDDAGERIIYFTPSNVHQITFPTPTPKEGYTVAWDKDELPLADVTVTAIYTRASYTIAFLDGENIILMPFTEDTIDTLVFPAPTQKPGYIAAWDRTPEQLELMDTLIRVEYTPITYTITFVGVEGVEPISYTIETMTEVRLPVLPERAGYLGKWDKDASELGLKDETLTALYTPITYTIEFALEGVEPISYTVESLSNVTLPTLPERTGYVGAWNKTTAELGLENVTLFPVYTPVVYTLTFLLDGIEEMTFTVETKDALRLPALPERLGYNGSWNKTAGELSLENTVLSPVYTAIEYTLSFECEGGLDSIQFTVETLADLVIPAVPEREGYRGEWDKAAEDIRLEDTLFTAIYTKTAQSSSSESEEGCFGTASIGAFALALAAIVPFIKTKKEE